MVLLNECDRGGRCLGVETIELEDGLDYVRGLVQLTGRVTQALLGNPTR